MNNYKTIFIVILVFVGVIYMLFQPAGGCEDTLYHTYQSPQGTKQASVYKRNCGATTHWTTKVVISDETDDVLLDFTLRAKPEESNIAIKWEDDKNVTISGFNFDDVTYLRKVYNPIAKVTYKPKL